MAKLADGEPQRQALWTSTLEAFVVRARRIESHSLAHNVEQLEFWAAGAMVIESDADGSIAITNHAPSDHERFESLAARVRPLLLHKDPIHYTKVIKALRGLSSMAGQPEWVAWSRELSKTWARADPSGGGNASYYMERLAKDGAPTDSSPDADLAKAWLYGDLVHADEHEPFLRDVGLTHRYLAAVLSVSRLVLLTRDLLATVTLLRDEGVVEMDESAFDEPVQVEPFEGEMLGLYLGKSEDGTVDRDSMVAAHEGEHRFAPGRHIARLPWDEGPYPPELRRP